LRAVFFLPENPVLRRMMQTDIMKSGERRGQERGIGMRRTQNRYIFASESARKSRRFRGLKVLLILIPLLLAALWVGNLTVSRRVILKDLRLTVLNLPPDLEEYSILHISDLRGARYGKAQKAVAAALGSTRYSCVVMTGICWAKTGSWSRCWSSWP
jgi:hypothetical protein